MLRWIEAVLATERFEESGSECLLAVSDCWSLRSTTGSGVRVSSSEERMEVMTCGLAGFALTRFGFLCLGADRRSRLWLLWCELPAGGSLDHGSDSGAGEARMSKSIMAICTPVGAVCSALLVILSKACSDASDSLEPHYFIYPEPYAVRLRAADSW